MEYIVRYLKVTKKKGITLKLEDDTFKAYVNSDFCRQQNKLMAEDNASTSKLYKGYVVIYTSYPVLWNSKLQIYIVLSTIEAEYITLLQALRDIIPII